MFFDPAAYGPAVSEILALDGNGSRLMPLVSGQCSSPRARALLNATNARQLFPNSRSPEAAFSGLWLYFSCLDESHALSQDIASSDGSFWHGIMHRQEPDAGNASYWFRRVGAHPIFPQLAEAASSLANQIPVSSFPPRVKWDPFAFIAFCEESRRDPGSSAERLALAIQNAEWQILFNHCASAAP